MKALGVFLIWYLFTKCVIGAVYSNPFLQYVATTLDRIISDSKSPKNNNVVLDTAEMYTQFDFNKHKEQDLLFWTKQMEERFRAKITNKKGHPLQVFIVPFSHNDAGWVKTFQEYFEQTTVNILNNAIEKLQTFEDMTFVWSEISFLAEWWKNTDVHAHAKFLELVREGRLEILTGGWVMPDEAVTHYFSLVNQLTEGHQWLINNLEILPTVGWSIDPFGHSGTMPYLLKISGITDGIVIQRVHYCWKRYFAEKQAGDFFWRQQWDKKGVHDVLTHHNPYEIYSLGRSCGPHSDICDEFDFKTQFNSKKITFKNVKERLELILSEYGRTGSLYRDNVAMISLGDDFRFSDESEWVDQYFNYKALIDFLSSVEKNYNANIRFGTPRDYFREIRHRQRNITSTYPILSGDFYPYSDFEKNSVVYWTGFYTTRPFWKGLNRKVEGNLRSAEILYTFALNFMRQNKLPHQYLFNLYESLTNARQKLSIFQHHDGITGTSRQYVMKDYLTMLLDSNTNALSIQTRAIQSLMFDQIIRFKSIAPALLAPTTLFTTFNQVNINIIVVEDYPRMIVVFNPLASWREDVVRLAISTPNVLVKDSKNKTVKHQIRPIWNMQHDNTTDDEPQLKISKKIFEVMFIIEIDALTLKTYSIEAKETNSDTVINEKSVIMTEYLPHDRNKIFLYEQFDNEIELNNRDLSVKIDTNLGHIKEIHNQRINTKIKCTDYYKLYKSVKTKSGAYLFKADSKTIKARFKHKFSMMIKGELMSEFITMYDDVIMHSIRLYNSNGPISQLVHVEDNIDIKNLPNDNINVELCTRFKTDINNGSPQKFYTDSNGFQMQKRIYVPTLGIDANYYPITTSIYIEDKTKRFSVLTSQSHGGSSNSLGSIEIMLDRRIKEDDKKGMGEGVLDTQKTVFNFWLLLENVNNKSNGITKGESTLLSDHLSDNLIYPSNVFVTDVLINPTDFSTELKLMTQSAPCGIHLVNFRTLTHPTIDNFPLSSALMTIQRKGSSADIQVTNKQEQNNDISNLIKCKRLPKNQFHVLHCNTSINCYIKSIFKVTLTGVRQNNDDEYGMLTDISFFKLKPFEMGSIRLIFDD